uniref:Uncharacterized protein n=1 Tax=Pseudo-nitzschia australis TaxID=44445 RepID=A0A7S4AX52_9STRA|mmetsp:Transcript_16524/g.33899  ORF Transcript_16524/g.33899 Transcript_16524/m.33899 type:complete len:456 (+) Transcript_16524:184-1551(+)|eukprot:CAMPEP_0168186862 /NCGR_PEP_ID=MMETSP0139_2-20121125/14681_1 /TAXON_ID=44445 /ORGANISM="Pseudo-nitzschia australis, Strain 10249 10 AB" /LENGTH=455 /DNA_ID=CAMNT_0008108943 /DNA_START=77 /DNA_END=1444 /DNA_ORIENTATION=+
MAVTADNPNLTTSIAGISAMIDPAMITSSNVHVNVDANNIVASTRSSNGTWSLSTDTTTSTIARASPSHLYAQQLNNSAALCLEVGQYSRAIKSLQKALELNRNNKKEWKDRNEQVCKCYQCTLEACISYSENTPTECTTVTSINSFLSVPNDNGIINDSTNSTNTNTNNGSSNKRRKVCILSAKKADSAFWRPPSYSKHHQQEQERQRQTRFSTNEDDTTNDIDTNKENEMSYVPFHKDIPRGPSAPQTSHREYHSDNDDDDDDSCSGGYIYRRPIRVSREGHAMGSTLYLIITFNLSLAHHLQTISSSYGRDTLQHNKLVNRTLVLYGLTYKWQLKLLCAGNKKANDKSTSLTTSSTIQSPSSCTAVTSIRFNMIIRNNLSQIHRLVGNHAKHKRCLQHLLSTVMVVTEYKSRMPVNRVVSNNAKDPRFMELDGFLQNTTAIVLQNGHCANAA